MEGVVETLLVNEGDHVRVGQPVAKLRLPERIAATRKTPDSLLSTRLATRARSAIAGMKNSLDASPLRPRGIKIRSNPNKSIHKAASREQRLLSILFRKLNIFRPGKRIWLYAELTRDG